MKLINYTTHQLNLIKKYKIHRKCRGANFRFKSDTISASDILFLLEKHGFKCLYCSEGLSPDTWQLDHFHPKANGGKNVSENLAPSCKWCNQMKGPLDGFGFLIRCKFISENNFIKNKFGEFYVTPKTSPKKLKNK